ncbi:hypothetical protein [Marinomonas pollencensis]|uniref:Spore coat protein U-like protein n=1 Tax=Marinomonas pollencensis TaxID=491954 RepID=A0A3E0DSX1_9GAMM|nr:hypothetical protein [Marinomonas pollencensis]REG86647.1 hypothetical protein DFP81_101212 [Marinomonas pollencensis]
MRKGIAIILFFFGINAYSSDEVSLTLVGYIPEKCSFTAESNDLTLSNNGLANTDLVIDCNSPMRVSMQSVNGGLRHQQSTQINDYRVALTIADANYSMSVLAHQLKSIKMFNVNDILFKSIAKLQVKLVDPLIYAGNYQDVIRIEMTPSAISGGVW